MIRFIIIMLAGILTLLGGCRSQQLPSIVESCTDSIVILRTDTLVSPADSATIRALLECNEQGRVVLRWLDIANSRNAAAQLTIDSLGNLLAKLQTPADTIYLPGKDILVTRDKPVPYPVEASLTLWEQIKIRFGGIALVLCCIAVTILGIRLAEVLKK